MPFQRCIKQDERNNNEYIVQFECKHWLVDSQSNLLLSLFAVSYITYIFRTYIQDCQFMKSEKRKFKLLHIVVISKIFRDITFYSYSVSNQDIEIINCYSIRFFFQCIFFIRTDCSQQLFLKILMFMPINTWRGRISNKFATQHLLIALTYDDENQ